MSEPDATSRPQPREWMLRYRGVVSFFMYLFLFSLAFFCAFGLFYNFKHLDKWFSPFFLPLLPLVVSIKMIVFARMKLFQGSWRYVGMHDVMSIVIATWISTFIFVVIFFVTENVYHILNPEVAGFIASRGVFPQSIFFLD